MTDDTTAMTPEQQQARTPRKRWISTLALVCVAAIVGGAGTVLVSSGEDGEGATYTGTPRTGKRIRGRCEELIQLTFNPRAVRGSRSKVAKVEIKFTYETDPRYRDLVKERIKENLDLIKSRTGSVLRKRTAYELNGYDSSVSKALDEDVRRAITGACFPDGVAMVDGILWLNIIVQ